MDTAAQGPNETPGTVNDSRRLVSETSHTAATLAAADARRAVYNEFKVFKPPFVLALFVMMNFWTYYDRGCMATAISSIRTDPSIATSGHPVSQTAAGALVSVFMVGYLIASPLFTGLGGVLSAKSIILIGLITWCVAALVTGLVHGFWGLLATRAFVGVGEAAYVGYTVTMVDNMAPPNKRTLWIGLFYSMVPVGTAVGMAMGGILSSEANTPTVSGWRWCFLTEVVPMAVVVLTMLFLPSEYNPVRDSRSTHHHNDAQVDLGGEGDQQHANGGKDDLGNPAFSSDDDDAGSADESSERQVAATQAADEFVSLPTAIRRLMCNIDYLLLVVSLATYTFVLGAISVWAVSMMTQGPLKQTKVSASLFLGGVTAVTGLLGSIAGGIFVDRVGGSQGLQGVYKCSLLNACLITVSVPCGLIALMVPNFAVFGVFLVISVFALFAITAPVNSAILTVVPKNLRTYAITCSIFMMHTVGDVPSPIIAGAISDAFNDGCKAWDHDEVMCNAARTNASHHPTCVWVHGSNKTHTDSFCTNEYQLRNALVIVFSVIALAIPAFGVSAARNRNRYGTAEHPLQQPLPSQSSTSPTVTDETSALLASSNK